MTDRLRRTRLTARVALPALAYLREVGANVDEVITRAGLARATLENPDARIDHERWVALLEIGMAATRDPYFGLHAAEHVSPELDSLPALLIRSASSMADGYAQVKRYLQLAHEGMIVEVRVEGKVARVTLSFQPGLAHPRVVSEFVIASWAVLGIQVLGPDSPPVEARFTHAPPESTTEHERVLGCPAVFAAAATELVVQADSLDAPVESASSLVRALLEDEARRLAERIPSDDTILARSVAWIRGELHVGREPRLSALADHLHMSDRTARRQLGAGGTTFRGLVDDVRREIAEGHLVAGRLSIDEISLLLGFSETVTFRRAFKRWTGRSPSEVRRERARAGSPTAGRG